MSSALTLKQMLQDITKKKAQWLAKQLAEEIKDVIGVQAPTRRTRSGRLVAATLAIRLAPPRKVSGKMWKSVKVVGFDVVINVPYAKILDRPGNHPFTKVALAQLRRRGGKR